MRFVLALVLAWCAIAQAETRRVAVVVGNNAGNAGETPLHYAETDAGKVGRVLAELGGVAPEDLFLLQGQDLAALTETFARAHRRIVAYQQDPANRVMVVFYFSGHSDGLALELGADRMSFADLRKWLASTGADVRLALVDSCKSGALLAAKGGARGPAFQIRLADELSSSGEALLTSSAADEVALESREIGGSFFTHHFVSGLRGAADSSGDGLVTLAEAYQYAYAHTIATTGATVIGPQHPAYDYRLSGQGELVLTELTKPSASLALPAGFTRALVIDLARDQVIAELTSDARTLVAVPPGRYAIRIWRGGRASAGRVALVTGEQRAVRWDELAAVAGGETAAKGTCEAAGCVHDTAPPREGDVLAIALELGGSEGVGTIDAGVATSIRLAVRAPEVSGWDVAITAGFARGTGFSETAALALAGYRLGLATGSVRAWGALDGGGGFVTQVPASGERATTGAVAIAPSVGASVAITRTIGLALEAAVPLALLRRDGALAVVPLPGVWLGIAVTP